MNKMSLLSWVCLYTYISSKVEGFSSVLFARHLEVSFNVDEFSTCYLQDLQKEISVTYI